jgi:hypothetical protein
MDGWRKSRGPKALCELNSREEGKGWDGDDSLNRIELIGWIHTTLSCPTELCHVNGHALHTLILMPFSEAEHAHGITYHMPPGRVDVPHGHWIASGAAISFSSFSVRVFFNFFFFWTLILNLNLILHRRTRASTVEQSREGIL